MSISRKGIQKEAKTQNIFYLLVFNFYLQELFRKSHRSRTLKSGNRWLEFGNC
jgi:hypothetical protein